MFMLVRLELRQVLVSYIIKQMLFGQNRPNAVILKILASQSSLCLFTRCFVGKLCDLEFFG
jgi:hypothetical protein